GGKAGHQSPPLEVSSETELQSADLRVRLDQNGPFRTHREIAFIRAVAAADESPEECVEHFPEESLHFRILSDIDRHHALRHRAVVALYQTDRGATVDGQGTVEEITALIGNGIDHAGNGGSRTDSQTH